MEDSNYQQQQDELCALEAIYGENFQKSLFLLVINESGSISVHSRFQFQMTKIVQNWLLQFIIITNTHQIVIQSLQYMLNGLQMNRLLI